MSEPRSPRFPHSPKSDSDTPSSASGRERSLHGWGRYPAVRGREIASERLESITAGAVLSRGLGRAYGDAGLPPDRSGQHVALTPLADRLLDFDPESGRLRAEAGVSLEALIEVFLARGWFTPVSPGTAHVTLGGMVASDIHGKNHHVAGTFGRYVNGITLRVANGQILDISRDREPELFHATIGGMGLTGHILEVDFTMMRVPSPWIWQESERHDDLASVVEALAAAGPDWPMTVAWIDCTLGGSRLGRGIVMKGRWAQPEEAPPDPPPAGSRFSLPFAIPSGIANRYTLGLLNRVWYALHGADKKVGLVNTYWFFYPLDSILNWPVVFGKRGFTQYQCVLPNSTEVFREFLEIFQDAGGASFVTVLKDCGSPGEGMLSFPKTGLSLAVDIPIAQARTQRMVDRLNDFVLSNEGRIYLAKDAFTRAEHFRRMYPRLEEWQAVRKKWDPEQRIRSAQSIRLLGDHE